MLATSQRLFPRLCLCAILAAGSGDNTEAEVRTEDRAWIEDETQLRGQWHSLRVVVEPRTASGEIQDWEES